MIEKALNLLFGSEREKNLKELLPILNEINSKELWAMSLKDEDFPRMTQNFKDRLNNNETLDDILPEAFALSREAARRKLGERAYDVQLLGGIALHKGNIMEMKTGEGKTLSSVAPSYLNSLTGKGVHMITVNDYLASRDAKWMTPVFDYLGLEVGCILSNMDPETRKVEYKKDITYGTNNEFGFDYLRDNMKWDIEKKAQKSHAFCIIDEIDSILIDEARTPLIISGAVDEDTSKFDIVNQLVSYLDEVVKDPKSGEYPKEDIFNPVEIIGDYKLEEKNKRVSFTNDGMNKIEELLTKRGVIEGSLFDEVNFEFIHYFTQAMKAHHLFHKDVDYVIQDGLVQIVDEFTGRVLNGRRYSEGLHQAIESKEGITVAKKNKTLASITFQNYFRMYDKISGMTGTADTEAREFSKIYNLDVVVIPTNRPIARIDQEDVIYLNKEYKLKAIADEVKEANKKGQPVLIGTVSVESSEEISNYFRKAGIRHEILNAKNHGREATIIAEAGAKGSVTIATNMAGRGTDIKLGGNPELRARRRVGTDATPEEYKNALEIEIEKSRADYEEVKSLGGLFVIGSERHESRRIDNQLRGRSGRQGDPGRSQFFVSLDDDLMRLFGGDRFKSTMSRLGMEGGEPIQHKLISNSLERAQKKVEERNYEIRKHLLDYDDVLNKQRIFIYEQRDEVLENSDLTSYVFETVEEIVDILLDDFENESRSNKTEAFTRLTLRLKDNFFYELTADIDLDLKSLKEKIIQDLYQDVETKSELASKEALNQFLKYESLKALDNKWQEHLERLDALREEVNLRTYAQKNPLVEYKNEGFAIFESLIDDVKVDLARKLMKIKVHKERRTQGMRQVRNINTTHRSMAQMAAVNGQRQEANGKGVQIKRVGEKIGRNDPCPCGSGKKYKKCCGENI
ncbi:preprotein translocase subunit SecA [Thiospirochaeta perfilievii]|uniref:Protein translocase subunit SecA n=1 Tax=Thiospirochaeta perfilievii TaxID=252967 RepID=A0A5C1QEH2_9SPIO|nr:preprotein translocase subunit SecA [Thiospirochaeta perfilievii]QEN05778.1 preprotein translocase subunit SecA [Thiospirochaeta perfilievii]